MTDIVTDDASSDMSDGNLTEERLNRYLQTKEKLTRDESKYLDLNFKRDRTPPEQKLFAALRTEQIARQRTRDAKKNRSRLEAQTRKAESEAARKARTHQMLEAAGLMGLAGLLDRQTGALQLDREIFMGALVALKEAINAKGDQGERFRLAGRTLLANSRQKPMNQPATPESRQG